MDVLQECMNMIAFSGEAKSLTFQAIKEAREHNFAQAAETLKMADASLIKGHQAHTNLLFYEADNKEIKVTLLLLHSADHLNSAETIRALADEIILIHKERETK